MKKRHLFRSSIVFITILSLVGCGMNDNGTNESTRNNEVQQQKMDTKKSYPQTLNQSQMNTIRDEMNELNSQYNARAYNNDANTDSNTTTNTNQGLSLDRYGHVSDRPEAAPKAQTKQNNPNYDKRYIHVQLLGINDLHGQLNVTRTVSGKPVGRVDYLASYLKQREAENKNTLLVHAGDMVGASPPVSALLQDEPTIQILNRLGFDIGTVGNHEFDEGLNELLRLINGGSHEKTGNFEGSSFPWVVANVINEKTGKTILPPHKVIKVNGMPIGFIGVCYSDTPTIVVPSGVAGLKFTDEAEAINRSVAELKKQGVRAIVVLAHNPGTSSYKGENASGELVDIANAVDDEVDIIYGAHNHQHMNAVVDGKLLVQSYSYSTAFSDVDIAIDPKTKDIVEKKAEIVTTFQEGIEPDQEIQQMLTAYEENVRPIVNRVIGNTTTTLTGQQNESGESILGNVIADSMRVAMKTDFAFMNPGGIRADVDQGEITWGELYTVQPFNNDLVKMTLTGQQVRDLLNQQFGPKTRMLQISGLKYTWDDNFEVGQKVRNIYLPDGTEIDPNKDYTVTVNNFMAGGGDNYLALLDGRDKVIGPVDIDALVDFIQSLSSPFTYSIEGRAQKVQY